MTQPGSADLLSCAVEAARAAGAHALQNEGRRREVAQAFQHDVKLLLDSECQAMAEGVVRHHYPTHSILGEEGETRREASEPTWIIDPIDGTVNFSHGLPFWCSSVAVQVGGEVVAGAVYAPVLRDLYTASLEQAALCNDQPIHVSDIRDMADALALTGLEKTFDTHQGTLEITRAMALNVRKVRILGAAALDVCLVAAGRAEAFFESGVFLWDIAAGALIVERAGGRVEKMEQLDKQRMRYLITNGHVHEELRAVIQRAMGR